MAGSKGMLATSPIRRIMKKGGADIVSKEALAFLIKHLETYAIKLTGKAVHFATHSKRKTIKKEDVELAINYTKV